MTETTVNTPEDTGQNDVNDVPSHKQESAPEKAVALFADLFLEQCLRKKRDGKAE